MEIFTQFFSFWNNLPIDVQTLLIGAGGELTGSITERIIIRLGKAFQKKPLEIALKKSLHKSGAIFISYLDIPCQEGELEIWLRHILSLLNSIFRDEVYLSILEDCVLHGNKDRNLEMTIISLWSKYYGGGGELTLPWRKNFGLVDATNALIDTFEYESKSEPQLHSFLVASRLKNILRLLEQGLQINGLENLVNSIRKLTEQQSQFGNLIQFLSYWGISIHENGILFIDQPRIFTSQDTSIENIFSILKQARKQFIENEDNEKFMYLSDFRTHIKHINEFHQIRNISLLLPKSIIPASIRIPIENNFIKVKMWQYEQRSDTKD